MPVPADATSMVARLAVLPRIGVVAAACSLAAVTATVSFAAGGRPSAPELVVPDVRRQAYVFAKGTLEEAGFAWRVRGPVKGYAANTVVAQSPAPGTRVVDTGAPTIALTLARNPRYAQKGTPENASPFAGTVARQVGVPVRVTVRAKPKARPAAKPAPKPDPRRPAFHVAGAPKEPLDEIRLDTRARRLGAWFAKGPQPTQANVDHWQYQHAWIVTGARFGWSHGETALRLLVGIDRKVEARWGMGSRSRSVAEQALAEVRVKSR
jgi:hypothetical protein